MNEMPSPKWFAVTLLLVTALLVGAGLAEAARVASGQVFVSSEKDDAIAAFDARSRQLLAVWRQCKRPRHLQLSPDRARLYVACSDDHRVDVASRKTLASLPVGDDPELFDLSRDGRMLYVSNEEDGLLSAYDTASGKRVFAVKVGEEPEGVKVSADGRRVYVTSEVANLVHVIDVATRKVVGNIQVGNRPRRLLLLRDGKELWVSNELSASVSVIHTDTLEVAHTIHFAPRGFRAGDVTPVGMAASSDGTRAYVGLGRANHVAAVDVASRRVLDYVLVGRRAWGLALSRDNARLYVANGLSDDVSVVDTASSKATATLKAGRVPHSVAIDD